MSSPTLLVVALFTATLAAGPPAAADDGAVERVVARWLPGKALEGVRVAVAVADARTGRLLAGHDADAVLNPASGTKLLTTAAALRRLDPERRWQTRLRGHRRDDTLEGPLVLQGGGDPKLMPGDLDALARALASAGVARVQGGILVDASLFDDASLPPAYDQKDTDAGYRASIGAAACNFGAVKVTVRAGARAGAPVRASVDPASDAVELVVRATTGAAKERSLTVRATGLPDGRTRIEVGGTWGRKAGRYQERRRVADPDLLSGYVLAARLAKADVAVEGGVRVVHAAPDDDPPPVLAEHTGASVADTVTDINTWSNNFMAEMLLKQLGCGATSSGPCSFERGVRAVGDELRALGLDAASFRVVNGSGLYRATQVAPSALVRLLVAMAADPAHRDAFRDSLAVAGQAGTLRARLGGKSTRGRVRAKTGTLDEVVTLAGYVPTRRGRTLAFAVIVNGATPARTASLRRAIDGLVRRLAAL